MTSEQLDQLVALATAVIAAQADYSAIRAAADAVKVAQVNAETILNARIVAGDDPDSADMRALIENRMATYVDWATKDFLSQSKVGLLNNARNAFEEAFAAIAFPES